MLGGYQTISLMDDNIYQKIVNSNSKAILVGDIVIDGVRKNSVYVPVTIAGGVVIFNAYGKQYTIGADNSITAVDHTEAEIYYFASLDAVPADLPEGSFVAVPSEGGSVPSWNDLTDRPFYFENGELLLENEVAETESHVCSKVVPLVVGNIYNVIVDGVEYMRTAYGMNGWVLVGDRALGGNDPFVVAYVPEEGGTMLMPLTVGSTFTISTVIVHKIDPMYIPGAYLPIVELETAFVLGEYLSDADNAKLTACIGNPAVIKIPSGSTFQCACVAQYSFIGDAHCFLLNFTGQSLLLSSADGVTWRYPT